MHGENLKLMRKSMYLIGHFHV